MNELKTVEDQLRAEIGQLKLELERQKRLAESGPSRQPSRPSRFTLTLLGIVLLVLVVAGFFRGYLPRQRREEVLAAEAKTTAESLPVVNVQQVQRSSSQSDPAAARKHPGHHRRAGDGAGHRLCPEALRGYRRSRPSRAGAGRNRSARTGPPIRQAQATIDQLKSTVRAGPSLARTGTAATPTWRASPRSGGPTWSPRAWSPNRKTTPTRRSMNPSRPTCTRSRRPWRRRKAMSRRRRPTWRASTS